MEVEAKVRKLELGDGNTLSTGDVGEDGDSPLMSTGDVEDGDITMQREEVLPSFDEGEVHVVTTSCDKGTQKPIVTLVPYKDMSERTKRNARADIVDLLKDAAMKTVHFVPEDLTSFVMDLLQNKKFCTTFGLPLDTEDIAENPTIQSLVKEYKSCVDKERKDEIRKRSSNQKSKICIGSSLNDSRVTLGGEKTPEHFKNRVAAASSIGRLTCYADERRRLLSIVAMDYPYSVLQELFNCSSKTITAAKVHCIFFGRGGTPPAKFKFTRQCVSPDVLMELSEFFQQDSVSRPSSCRSVVTNKEETPIRYWKDSEATRNEQFTSRACRIQ
ncbi:hypothetical protein OS493_036116 [Desmophyllum pertusum]|uniref:Uncharacterized protein n=1 Tax=Desmophyllum pertusum TaxID=174260 RepID=A0A9W9Y7J9_9CNID|nr:hypothetical protein OS493_036116 [Desmophyllum pertusum]